MLLIPSLMGEIDLNTAIHDLPQSQRPGVIAEICKELEKFRSHMNTPEFFMDYARLNPSINGNVKSIVPELFESFRSRAEEKHTLDWVYEEWRKAKDRPQQTQDDGQRYIDDFKRSARVRGLAAIRRRHLLDWRDELKQDGSLGPRSINHRLEIVTAILRTGWRDAEIQPPDLSHISVPEPDESGRAAWISGEILAVLRALEPHTWAAWVFLIGLTTGVRLGEPVAAQKDWFDAEGFIHVPPSYTKRKKRHVLPIIELIRQPLTEYINARPSGYLFDAPRPSKPGLKISHEASKWFGCFFDRCKVDKVFHELRNTWIWAAEKSEIKAQVYKVISGHAPADVADRYGGAKPPELLAANEKICAQFLTNDAHIVAHIRRLVD